MDRLDAMKAFLAVADKASFAAAARHLRWSPATVTRAVAAIEADLGLLLFHRTTRSVRLTDLGAIYAERCRAILDDAEEARNLVRGEGTAPRGTLSVTAPAMFGRLHILPIVEALRRHHPDLAIRLTFVDRIAHLVEEGFDIAVRIGELADSALIAWQAGKVRRLIVASPDYLARRGEPRTSSDLRGHDIVAFEGVDSTNDWQFGASGRTSVTVAPILSTNAADAALHLIERGHGIGRLLSYQVEEALKAGRVRRLLTAEEPGPVPVSLVCQASRRTSPNIQAFMVEARRHFAGTRLLV